MTPEMAAQRIGKMTASMAAVVMGGLETEGLKKYVNELAYERAFGDDSDEDEQFETAAMRRGKRLEAAALDWYAFEHDADLIPGGVCIDHPTIPFVGASPDARLPDRVIEAKCPGKNGWMEVRQTHKVPSQYRWQCRWQMWVLDLPLCDFICWRPGGCGIVVPIAVTDDEIAEMTARAILVNDRINQKVAELLNPQRKAA